MKYFDITRDLAASLAPWPGDAHFSFSLIERLSEGSSVNLGRVTTSVHSGTHADAFFHFDEDGLTIDRFSPERYLGPATVIDLMGRCGGALGEITVDDLTGRVTSPRILLKTGVWPDSTKFPEAIPFLAEGVVNWLRGEGVVLLGLDLPSVDALDSKELRNHHALAKAGISILEGLDLRGVEAGKYWLAALPLKIIGGDGAPVRAVLWREGPV
ncbi:MAG: cyclase family protein [Chthoniobacterales bacterium]